MTSVGIIGAGAAGLCSLRHSLSHPQLQPILWEKSRSVGGTWIYSESCGSDEFGLPTHSSMYKNLRTDIPKEVMSFPDFPFKNGTESFVGHEDVNSYLHDYADNFGLRQHIKFCHHVEKVNKVQSSTGIKWKVSVRNLLTDEVQENLCDALIVCNGHNSVPLYPDIPGIESFSGLKDHSHNYRVPETYRDKTVIVLGASASGKGIAVELDAVAKKVYLSHNSPLTWPSPDSIEQISGVESFNESSQFKLKNGKTVTADAIIYCTGYEYSYPFLSEDCEVEVTNNQVWPLYRHLIHCKYPTMALVGITNHMIPFPFFNVQVEYFLLTLISEISLPSSDSMLESLELDMEKRKSLGEKQRHYHLMGIKMLSYVDELQKDINSCITYRQQCNRTTSFPSFVRSLFNVVLIRIFFNFENHTKYKYPIDDKNSVDGVTVKEVYDGVEATPGTGNLMLLLKKVPLYLLLNFPAVCKVLLRTIYYKTKEFIFYRN